MECRKKLFLFVESWKETPGLEEERVFKKLKETTMNKKIAEELGRSRNTSNDNPKPNLSKNPTLVLDPSKKKTMTPLKMKMTGEDLGATPQWP